MESERIRDFVEDERSTLCEGRESICDAVVLRPKSGTDIAVGLLSLGDVAESIEWFAAVSEEWEDGGSGAFRAKYVDGDDEHAQGKQWKYYQRSLQTGILGQVDTTVEAENIVEKATRDFIDTLPSRELEPRIDLIRALGCFLATDECNVDELRSRAEQTGREFDRAYYLPQAALIEAISDGDPSTVEDNIQKLVDFHREFVSGAPDTNVIDEAVAFDACSYLALAQREGVAVEIDSEYVPSVLTDEEWYSIEDV